MVILAYGVEQPTTGDPGSVFFPILERLCQKFSVHNHDGVNSAPISASAISSQSVLIEVADWSLVSAGLYEATITLPPNFDYDEVLVECREEVTQEIMYCEVVKVTDTQCTIRVISNDLEVRVYFK